MSQYIVSARKYRPATFDSVVGQAALTSTLKNAILAERLAHAYLFCGSRGVGKTSCARIFAKTINCTNRTPAGEACNECPSCRAFNDSNSLNIVELDAASHNGIDDIKSLIEQVQIPPTHGRYRVFIIDEVHMLSAAAFNAFLKTLEEPPAYVIFILATTEKHKIIPTILSRCQIYDFNRISVNDMAAHLASVAEAEGIRFEPAALNVIARQADGAMRDALSIFDQVAASSRGNITYASTIENLNVLDSSNYLEILRAFQNDDIPSAILTFHQIRRKGFDPRFFLNGLAQFMRDLMLASSPATLDLLDQPDDIKAQMAQTASKLSPAFIYAAMALCNDADLNYRQAADKQLLIEVTLIRIAQLLNPSPVKSDLGEGLKPISKSADSAKVTPGRQPEPSSAQNNSAPAHPTASKPNSVAPAQSAVTASGSNATVHSTPPTASASPRQDLSNPAARRSHDGLELRVGQLSMHKIHDDSKKSEIVIHRGRPFTPQMMTEAWAAVADTFRTEPALENLLKKFTPELAPDGRIVLAVDSTASRDFIARRLDDIIPKMRDALANDDFDIVFSVSQQGLGPEFWSDSQVVNHLLKNPEFAEFYRAFNLTLL